MSVAVGLGRVTVLPPLSIRMIETRLVSVPLRRPLGTSAMQITHAPLLLIDVHTEQGVVGRTYLFCYLQSNGIAAKAIAEDASTRLAGHSAAPLAVKGTLQTHFRLLGARGTVAMVMAGIDAACWDALAVAVQVPLATLLGAPLRATAAYNSNGLGLLAPQAAADEALQLLAEGFGAVKMRLGRPRADDDLAAVRAVRRALPAAALLMVDFNQALLGVDARDRCGQLDDEGVYWIEEPVRHDDLATLASLAAHLHTPVQIGENFVGPRAMSQAMAAGASDLVMPDLERIGGVSGWLAAAALAEVHGMPMSSHLFPEVSAHLLAATPTAHWLEYVDWANPIVEQPLQLIDGAIGPSTRIGSGLSWNESEVRRFLVA